MPRAKVHITGMIAPDDWFLGEYYVPHTSLSGIKYELDWMKEWYSAEPGGFEGIDVTINSDGGSYTEGMGIFDLLRSYGVPVATTIFGTCGSIATAIFMAGDTRLISENSEFFVHLPEGGVGGNVNDISAYLSDLQAKTDALIDFYVEKTGSGRDQIASLLAGSTTLTAQQAVDYGFATGIYQPVTARRYTYAEKAVLALKIQAAGPQKATATKSQVMSKLDTLGKSLLSSFNSILAIAKGQPVTALKVASGDKELDIAVPEGEEIAVGQAVTIDGQPAPDGEYPIENDTKTLVVKDGVIAEIKLTETETEEETEAKAGDSDDVTALKAEIEDLKSQLAAAGQQFTAFKTQTEAVMNQAKVALGLKVSKDIPITAEAGRMPGEKENPDADRQAMLAARLEARKKK